MKLAFLCHPVKYLKGSVRYYREVLGFEEAWQEGDHTVALKLPGSDVQLMLEDDGDGFPPGGVFIVDSVDRYYEENSTLEFVKDLVISHQEGSPSFKTNQGTRFALSIKARN
ncbi:VOC family protein [Peribacillus sp. NPDC097675]|uniref:VOC family protein n=1 Tax=Peribacillus sp. NPDC097675 TaxID=3390618 RepID=UPI003D060A5D